MQHDTNHKLLMVYIVPFYVEPPATRDFECAYAVHKIEDILTR